MMATYLDLYMKEVADYELPEGGLAFWLVFKKPINTVELAEQLLKNGVQVISTERVSFDEQPLNALRLGYASLEAEEMERGIRLIVALLR